jgi:hypothetical protein
VDVFHQTPQYHRKAAVRQDPMKEVTVRRVIASELVSLDVIVAVTWQDARREERPAKPMLVTFNTTYSVSSIAVYIKRCRNVLHYS